ncbi:hypothetical protein BH23BAC1_BH23BAC1_47960 [soil metagenome]
MKAKGISVIICCYNSAGRIKTTLKRLSLQESEGFPIEIILVDNASGDDTSAVAENYWASLDKISPIKLKIIQEPKPGLSHARKAGMQTSNYEYVLYCDDDNHLYSNYCKLAFHHLESMPDVGVLGGQGIGKYQVQPPDWFIENEGYFAIGKQASESGDLTHTKGYVWGAGMVIRRRAWDMLAESNFESFLSDRKGKSLTSGGDVEFCKAIRLHGFKIYYDENLKYDHEIPAHRMEWKKLRKMVYATGTSATLLLPHELHYRLKYQQLSPEKLTWEYHFRKSLKWFRSRKSLLLKTLIFSIPGNDEELDVLYQWGFLTHLVWNKNQYQKNLIKVKNYQIQSNKLNIAWNGR